VLREISKDLIERGCKTGNLVRLSKGPSTEAFATKTLWQSLLWRYPSALPLDVIHVPTLIEDVCSWLIFDLSYPREQPLYNSYRPDSKPLWLSDEFSIAACLLPSNALLLSLEHETPPFDSNSKALPAALLFKILSLTRNLFYVARKNDRPALAKFQDAALSLLDAHPLVRHTPNALSNPCVRQELPSHLSAHDYRALLITELARQLELLFACGLPEKDFLALAKHFELLRTPLSELLHLTRSLILLAARLPDNASHLSPFDDLLSHYATLRALIGQTNPLIPKPLIKRLRLHAYSLTKLLPLLHTEELRSVEHALAILDSISDAFVTGATYPPTYHVFH
jgi:hypothetical protein